MFQYSIISENIVSNLADILYFVYMGTDRLFVGQFDELLEAIILEQLFNVLGASCGLPITVYCVRRYGIAVRPLPYPCLFRSPAIICFSLLTSLLLAAYGPYDL